MRKVRADGLDLPIGLPPPAAALSPTLEAQKKTDIEEFDDIAEWQLHHPGDFILGRNELPRGLDGGSHNGVGAVGGAAIEFIALQPHYPPLGTGPGEYDGPLGHYAFWSKPSSLDLSQVGTAKASDDDLMHMWIKLSHPSDTEEVRLYFVVSNDYVGGVLPGAGSNTENTNYYVKSFRASDIVEWTNLQGSQTDTAERIRQRRRRDEALRLALRLENTPFGVTAAADQARAEGVTLATADERFHRRRPSTEYNPEEGDPVMEEQDDDRMATEQLSPGQHMWKEFGVRGVPLRRGDFRRVGTDTTRHWGTITGIFVYVQTIRWEKIEHVKGISVAFDNAFLHGGSGPDTTEPESIPYDWRYTHYDPRTGAESNPSPIMANTDRLDSERRGVVLQGSAFGDGAIRQRFYRRGGGLNDDWYFIKASESDGGSKVDDKADLEIAAANTVQLDHFQPVASVDGAGNEVLAKPVPVLFGPVAGLLFALGDPNRPGDVYYCKRDEPDHWPSDNRTEVCSPSEELMTGTVYAGQAFCFSRRAMYALYPDLVVQGKVSGTPTPCRKGTWSRWGVTSGYGGIYFVSTDGVYRTTGGEPELISWDIDPIFHGQTINGYEPVDFTKPKSIRLQVYDLELWFMYENTVGETPIMIYNLINKKWRNYAFSHNLSSIYADTDQEVQQMVLGRRTGGASYRHDGLSDVGGTPIECNIRTPDIDMGRPREDKRMGDVILDADPDGVVITAQVRLNNGAVTNTAAGVGLDGGIPQSGRNRWILDHFGTVPQLARNVSVDLNWDVAGNSPTLYFLGISYIPQPEATQARVTQWDEMGTPTESYLTGVMIDCNTFNEVKRIVVEYDINGAIFEAANFTVQSDRRHRFFFSWPAVKANLVRIRPEEEDPNCTPWILYRLDWIADPEPPRIAGWDSNFENHWDTYYTGLDLEVDTFGTTKTIEVYVDGVLVKTESISSSGRAVKHITLGPARGHIYRFVATDSNAGLLYAHRWFLEEEPSEQTNWNQNFTIVRTHNDKYLKGIILQVDTFNVAKTAIIEVDGVTVETLNVQANDRQILQFSFAQHLGRVFRLRSTDGVASRLYTCQWIFDEEPLQLARWETQELNHGIPGWQSVLRGYITLKSTADVTLTITSYNQNGVATTQNFTIPHTSGVKNQLFVPFGAIKGTLFKYTFTSSAAFHLYREESELLVQPWGAEESQVVQPFGNNDLDLVRNISAEGRLEHRGES
jgi:hypothetical protein